MSSSSSSAAMTIGATALATATLLVLLRSALYPRHDKVLASPLRSLLPELPPDQVAQLDYAPDAFPGSRDVPTPYGSIRVYEFGPVSGRKVLLVHGISTSCQTLGPVAQGLVDYAGCRVMLFDLFGRGFSDGVGDLPHDARLYCSQMLLALASSPLSWTGNAAFDLLGYSMGGGIAVQFTTAFPHMVRSLILLAPAGLIRPERFGVAARFIFTSGVVPERLLAAVTRRRLRQPIANSQKDKPRVAAPAGRPVVAEAVSEGTKPVDIAIAEASDAQGTATEQQPPESDGHALSMQVMRYVRWMLSNHQGFVPAFMSCIRDAPLVGQEAAWGALARLVRGSTDEKGKEGIPLCVVLARNDAVVDAQDYAVDALPLLGGPDKVMWRVVPGGHEFPMTYSRHVLRAVFEFWDGMGEAVAKLRVEDEKEEARRREKEKVHQGQGAQNGNRGPAKAEMPERHG